MLDYRIDTFLLLCECMNYRKTAEALHLSQPAVTQQIQYLERLYGCRLFTFEKRRLEKTDAAVLLERYARAARLQEHALRDKLADKEINALRVGATKTIGDYFMEPYICSFLQRKENALKLIVDNTEHLLRSLEKNELDFAVVEGFFDKDRFDSVLLRREPFVGICRRDHPFAGGRSPSTSCCGRLSFTGRPAAAPGQFSNRSCAAITSRCSGSSGTSASPASS